jgi:hypothetical protein
MLQYIRNMARDASGAMIVEFALVFPVVLLLTMGSVDVAMYTYQANAAAKATELGARWAVVNPPISANFVTALNSTSWWPDGSLGKSCQEVAGGCWPTASASYDCISAGCNMTTILAEMQRAYPQLTAAEVQVSYQIHPQARSIGFVGRPGGNPVDVVVSIRCKPFQFAFLTAFMNWTLPANAACPNSPTGFLIPPSPTRLTSESFGPPA